MKKIFIACPISKYLNGNEFINNDFKEFINEISILCRSYSDNVFLALEREKYGENRMEDVVCSKLDYEEMIDTDVFVAIPEDSQGVAVEAGWASALNKKVIMMLDSNYKISPLINALHVITDTEIISLNSGNGYKMCKQNVLNELNKKLSKLNFD